jgi:hypothetical protein
MEKEQQNHDGDINLEKWPPACCIWDELGGETRRQHAPALIPNRCNVAENVSLKRGAGSPPARTELEAGTTRWGQAEA